MPPKGTQKQTESMVKTEDSAKILYILDCFAADESCPGIYTALQHPPMAFSFTNPRFLLEFQQAVYVIPLESPLM